VAKNFSERIDLAIAHAASATDALKYRALKARVTAPARGDRTSVKCCRATGDALVFQRLLEAAVYASDHAWARV